MTDAIRGAKAADTDAIVALHDTGLLSDANQYVFALRASRLLGLPDTVEKLFSEMRQAYEPTVVAFAELLLMYEGNSNWSSIMESFDEMTRLGVQADITCYNALLHAYSKVGRFRETARVILQMQSAGVGLTLASCTWALKTCFGKSEFQSVWRAVKVSGVQLDSRCYTLALQHFGRSELNQACELFSKLRQQGFPMDHGIITAFLRGCLRLSGWQGSAQSFFKDLEADLNSPLSEVHYDMAISECERQGLWQEVLLLASQMGARGLNLDAITCNSVLTACMELGQWQVAVNLLETMQSGGTTLDTTAYAIVLRACASAGQWDEVIRLFDQIRNLGPGPRGAEIAAPVILSLVEVGRLADAVQVYREAASQKWLPTLTKRRLSGGPRLLDARTFQLQVAVVAVRAVLEETAESVAGAVDRGDAMRMALNGFSEPGPQDIIVLVTRDSLAVAPSGKVEPINDSVAEGVLAVAREVLGTEAKVECLLDPYAAVRIAGLALQDFLVRRVQQAVSDFTPSSEQVTSVGGSNIAQRQAGWTPKTSPRSL